MKSNQNKIKMNLVTIFMKTKQSKAKQIKTNRKMNLINIFILLAVALFASSSVLAELPVNLGTAGDFAVLSDAGITTTGTTLINGDIGVGPAVTAAAMTGFGLTMDASNQFSTSALVNGSIYAFDYSPPTPTKMNTAILDMQAAYTDAAGRAVSVTDLGAGTLTDLTLAPGVYAWGTAVSIPTDLTLSGSATDVWVFKVAGTLTMAAAKNITLTGGAKAENVFWQVSGAVNLGANTHFEGNVLSGTGINLGDQASVNGRLLAQTAVTLIGNSISIPASGPIIIPPTSGPVFIDTNLNNALDSGELFFNTIQLAVNTAISGDTIVVTNGTYNESGQILINKNLTIIGENKYAVVIKPAQDTGSANDDAAAWILVQSGIKFNLANVTLDGDSPTRLIKWGLATYGTGTIDNVIVKNVKYNIYEGRGVVVFGNVTISNNRFENIQRIGVHVRGAYSGLAIGEATIINSIFVGKGNGDFLDYGIEVGAGAFATITNNIISDARGVASSDGSDSAAILITDYYGTGTAAVVIGNTIANNSNGLYVGYLDTDASVVTAHQNKFMGNTVAVISTAPVVDATNNWWGTNVESEILALISGNVTVSGNVTYAPWHTSENMTSLDTTLTDNGDGTLSSELSETILEIPEVKVEISAGTNTTGNMLWDGIINGPTIKPAADVNPTAPQGLTTQVSKVVEVGVPGLKLTFDKAAKIFMLGESGKRAGYTFDGATFNDIDAVCADNTQATNDLLPASGDCFFDDGANLTIWTKHFTQFVTYTFTGFPSVYLGEAGNFVILAESGITNAPTSAIIGDVGLSPTTGAAITGLACAEVNGTIYTIDGAGPIGLCNVQNTTLLTAAVGDMHIAYADVLGRNSTPANTDVGGATPTNITFAPGVYKWTTGVTIPAGSHLTLSGNSTDVWIFQITGALTTGADTRINLIGGAQVQNVFWQATAATLGATSVFDGTILSGTAVTLGAGATLNGRALAQSAVTLDSDSVVIAGPPVIATITLVPTSATLLVGFTGETLQLNATALDQFGVPMTAQINYTSNDTAVATVSPLGLVTAVSAGSASITATSAADAAINATSAITVETAAPILNNIGARSVTQGTLLNLTITAISPSGFNLTFNLSGNTTAMTFIDNLDGTATFSWTPILTDVNTTTPLNFTVTDGIKSDSELVPITVNLFDAPVTSPSTPPANQIVDLGSAGNFVILAKSGISTTGTTLIVGDIGVSPIAATGITGFGLIMDASNTFATSSLVNGRVYAADYAVPTPVAMTTAISDMQTAYVAAAGRTNPTATELGAGDISGMTLAPGLYKWTTGLLINAGSITGDPLGVTLDCQGNADAVYVFQIAQTLTVGNGAKVTLTSNCQPQNIFWQVALTTTLGTTSVFNGNILDQTDIAIQTGAVLNGRALAQTAVTLDSNNVTAVPVTLPAPSTSAWQNADYSVTLSAMGFNNTPVEYINYTLNGVLGQIIGGFGNVLISTEGNNTLVFYSVDTSGNTEAPQIINVLLDKTAPTITAFTLSSTSWLTGDVITGICTATDNLDPNPVIAITGDTSTPGTKNATCTATDAAGNRNQSMLNYTVTQRPSGSSGGSSGGSGGGSSGGAVLSGSSGGGTGGLTSTSGDESYIIRTCLRLGQSVNYYLDYNVKHTLSLASYDNGLATVRTDTGVEARLMNTSSPAYMDVNGNGYDDFKVSPDVFSDDRACFYLYEVREKIPVQAAPAAPAEPAQQPEIVQVPAPAEAAPTAGNDLTGAVVGGGNTSSLWIALAAIVIIAGAITGLYFLSRKPKEYY